MTMAGCRNTYAGEVNADGARRADARCSCERLRDEEGKLPKDQHDPPAGKLDKGGRGNEMTDRSRQEKTQSLEVERCPVQDVRRALRSTNSRRSTKKYMESCHEDDRLSTASSDSWECPSWRGPPHSPRSHTARHRLYCLPVPDRSGLLRLLVDEGYPAWCARSALSLNRHLLEVATPHPAGPVMELYCGTTCSRWRCYAHLRCSGSSAAFVGRAVRGPFSVVGDQVDDRLGSHLRRRGPTSQLWARRWWREHPNGDDDRDHSRNRFGTSMSFTHVLL